MAWNPEAIANSYLGLHTEQEGGGKALNIINTRNMTRTLLCLWKMIWLKISMDPEDEMPGRSKYNPGKEVKRSKDQESVPPLPFQATSEPILSSLSS